jgi:hypothetical protein
MVVQQFIKSRVTRTGGVWVTPAGDVFTRSVGASIAAVQTVTTSAVINGSTITGKLQGSNDNGATWIDVADGSASATVTGQTAAMGGADQLLTIVQFNKLKFVVSEAGGPPNDGSFVDFYLTSDFSQD